MVLRGLSIAPRLDQLEGVGGHHSWATSSGSQQGRGSGAVVLEGSIRGRRSEEMIREELWW